VFACGSFRLKILTIFSFVYLCVVVVVAQSGEARRLEVCNRIRRAINRSVSEGANGVFREGECLSHVLTLVSNADLNNLLCTRGAGEERPLIALRSNRHVAGNAQQAALGGEAID
jgi:hypothetical protein